MGDPSNVNRHTVLCIDPDSENANLYATLLGKEYHVTTAATALDALRHSNERSFDAFITEFWLPDWAGPSLCRQIRESDPHAPVLFCTGAQKETDRERAIRAGASAYMLKPIDPPLLLSKMRALLTLAVANVARARVIAERAVQAELQRRLDAFREGRSTALVGAERAARKKALAAFTQAGGTHAMFSRTWPEMLIGGQAAAGYTPDSGTPASSSGGPKVAPA